MRLGRGGRGESSTPQPKTSSAQAHKSKSPEDLCSYSEHEHHKRGAVSPLFGMTLGISQRDWHRRNRHVNLVRPGWMGL